MTNEKNSILKTTYWRSTGADELGVYRYIPFPNTCLIISKPRHDSRTNADYVLIDDDLLKVNTHNGKYQVRVDILWSGYRRMKWIQEKCNRIFQIRLETPTFRSEAECKKFVRVLDALIRFTKRYYNTKYVQYLYVRENSSNRGWHYHLVIWIDGKVCRNQHVIWQKWNQLLWDAHLLMKLDKHGNPNEIKKVKGGGVMVKRSDSNGTSTAVLAWSYLAKPRTKGRGAINTRDFQTSMLPRIRS